MIRYLVFVILLFFCSNSSFSVEYTDNTILQSKYMKNTEKGVKVFDYKLYFEDQPEHTQKKIIKRCAKIGLCLIDISDYWYLIDDINTAYHASLSEDEPFNKYVIDIFDNQFGQINDENKKFHVAAILYRYGRDNGEEFLLKSLNDCEPKDAKCKNIIMFFILNKEQDQFQTIDEYMSSHDNISELIFLLGSWGRDSTTYLLSRFASSPRYHLLDYVKAFSLSSHKVDDASYSRIENLFHNIQNRSIQMIIAGALYKLNSENKISSEFLDNQILDYDSLNYSDKDSLLSTLKRVNYKRGEDLAIRILEEYNNKEDSKSIGRIEINAAILLSGLYTEKGNKAFYNFIRKTNEKNVPIKKIASFYRIMLSKNPESRTELIKIIGEQEVNNIEGFNKLKLLTKKYLPFETRKYYQYDIYFKIQM